MPRYRVEVAGHVGPRFADTFDVALVEMRGGRTILTVDLPDQAALHGLLDVLQGAGVELLAVNPDPEADEHVPPSPG